MSGFQHILIDGYNLLHQELSPERRSNLQTARQRLVRRIEQAAHWLAPRTTVVFDGCEGGRDAALDTPRLEVVFSPAGRTADGLIEQMVHDAAHPDRMLVVTSDYAEQTVVSAFGASVISCREFLLRCDQAVSEPPRRTSRRAAGPTLGDFFPDSDSA